MLTHFFVCFIYSFHAVELLRQGYSLTTAARMALKKIARYYPTFRGGLITVTKDGRHGMTTLVNTAIEVTFSVFRNVMEHGLSCLIQLFRERLKEKSTKVHATRPEGSMGRSIELYCTCLM